MAHKLDNAILKQYLADDPPTVVLLGIKPHFEALSDKEKKYAHYISMASLSGTRINLRQMSHESEAIYDFILALHRSCYGTFALAFVRAVDDQCLHSVANVHLVYMCTYSR